MDAKEAKIYTAVLVTCFIVGIIIVYFAVSLIRQQRRYLAISRRNVMAEMAMLDKERMRIAADLHDELSPMLTAVKFQINSIDSIMGEDKQALDTSFGQLTYISKRLSEIIKDLMPVSLVKRGLVSALEEFFNMINQSASMKVFFSHKVTSSIAEEKRINCYRLVQEITHNALKHSKATLFVVQLEEQNSILKLLCEDNGTGFDYEKKMAEESGIGLRSIKGRAEILSRRFQVTSVQGKGTQYILEIPLS